MNIYEDFDTNEQQNPKQKKKQKKNTFIFESFNDRMKKIKVRFANNLQNDISFMNVDEGGDHQVKFSENESNFMTMINREKVLNATPEFLDFLGQLKPYMASYLLMINNSTKIINILSSTLDQQINLNSEDGKMIDRLKENALNQRNYPFIMSVLEVTIGFVKDIREDACETFLVTLLPNLIKLLTHSNNTELIDKIFSVFVNIFKFLNKGIQKHFRNFFLIFSELIFNKNKSIRKFSCESVCFLIKNLDKKELSEVLKIIFEVFNNPQILFSDLNDRDENEDVKLLKLNNNSNQLSFDEKLIDLANIEFSSSKEYIDEIISNFNPGKIVNLNIFILDAISDLLMELLVGINKNLSIRADLILEKISSCFTEEEENTNEMVDVDQVPFRSKNYEYLIFMKDLTVVLTILKLYKFINENQKSSVISLFHYYLTTTNQNSNNKSSQLSSFPKFNLETFPRQVNLIQNKLNLKSNIISLIFISEFVKRFYKDFDSKLINYSLQFFQILSVNETSKSNRILVIEIMTIFMKLFPEEMSSYFKLNSENSLLTGENSSLSIFTDLNNLFLLDNFLNGLKKLQNFNDFSAMLYFSEKKINPYYSNDDWESTYNKNLINLIFQSILNEVNLMTGDRVLNVITTFSYLLSDKSETLFSERKEIALTDKNLLINLGKSKNEELIKIYLLENKSTIWIKIKEEFNLDNYMNLWTYLIMLRMVNYDPALVLNFDDHLLGLIESSTNDSLLTQGLVDKEYLDILISEFDNENVYYLSRKSCLLNLLSNFISISISLNLKISNDSYIKKLVKILLNNKSHIVVFKMLLKIIEIYFNNDKIDFLKFLNTINIDIGINTEFYHDSLKLLISKENSLKADYLKFIKFVYYDFDVNTINDTNTVSHNQTQQFNPSQHNTPLIGDIFSIMEDTFSIVFDLKNDKKYKFNLEILMSKVEALIPEVQTNLNSEQFNLSSSSTYLKTLVLIYYFLTGSYWIRYTKSVWGTITKSLERLYEIISSTSEKSLIFSLINKQVETTLNFIRTIGKPDDLITKYGKSSNVILSYYLTFSNKSGITSKNSNSTSSAEESLKHNLINLIFLNKGDEMNFSITSPSLFYDGFLQGLQGYHLLLDSEALILHKFLNVTIALFTNYSEYSFDSPKDERVNYYCLFNNYILDKEHKSGALLRKLEEGLLLSLSKCNFKNRRLSQDDMALEFDYDKFINLLYKQIIISKSQNIQKFCVAIITSLEDRLKPYRGLLQSIIENTNVIDRLHNLDNIVTDTNRTIEEDERAVLIPLVIRLYYSKYFYLNSDNKKLKTKNKINLVSFFIQLRKEEFDEYVKIIFEPLSADIGNYVHITELGNINHYLDTGFNFSHFDLRAYKKILEILGLNLKQITKLFSTSISFIASLLKSILLFTKNLDYIIKNSEPQKFYENFEISIKTSNIQNTRFVNYFNQEGLSQYLNFFQKNSKDIKKTTFSLLKIICSKFYSKEELVLSITKDICDNYKGNSLNFSTLNKPNSMLNFFGSFARIPHLHFVYIQNEILFKKLLEVFQNKEVENVMLNTMLEFLENILTPYSDVKLEISNQQMKQLKQTEKEKEKDKLTQNIDEDVEMEEAEQAEEENNSEENLSNEGSVIIEELNLNEETEEVFPSLSLDQLQRNENLLITSNFTLINDSLIQLVKNNKIKLTIKDNNTRKVIEILVYLWNTFKEGIAIESHSVEALLNFLHSLFRHDNKIFKYQNRQTLTDLLKICHILFRLYPDFCARYYRDFLKLIYRIDDFDSNNKLILTILLQEFDSIYGDKETFANILLYITNLNLLKVKGKLKLDDNESNLDIDSTIDKLNEITPHFIKQFKFYHLEPLVYILLVFTRSSDYSLQTIAVNKLKILFESVDNISELLLNDKTIDESKTAFREVFNTMFEMFNTSGKFMNVSLSRTILEIISHINSLLTSKEFDGVEYLCRDLFYLTLNETTANNSSENEIANLINPNVETIFDNFFSAIFNVKYDVRISALRVLNPNFIKLNYFSLIKIVLPIIKNFLSPFSYLGKKRGSHVNQSAHLPREAELSKLLNTTIDCIPNICRALTTSDAKDFLLFFQQSIEKLSKKPIFVEEAGVDLQSCLYRGLTKAVETLTAMYFTSSFDFDKEFNSRMRVMIEEYNNAPEDTQPQTNKTQFLQSITMTRSETYNKDLFKRVFESLSIDYKNKNLERIKEFQEEKELRELRDNNSEKTNFRNDNKEGDILYLLKTRIYRLIKGILIDTRKKEKGKSYYIRNYVIRPYVAILKLLDPHQIKYELISMNYEIINNLKNRDLSVREKTREGMKILFESTSIFISSMILEEIKSQLHSGYQRYIKGYTCNFLINLINKSENEDDIRLELDFASWLIMPILLDELFGEVAEEKEIEILVNKYKEAKQTKAFQSFFILCSKMNLKRAIVNVVYPLWDYLMRKENDASHFTKAQEGVNHMIKGLKNNPSLNFEDVLGYSNGLIKLGIDINLKNAKEVHENKKVTQKGDLGEMTNNKRKSYQRMQDETMTVQLGALNGRNYTLEIAHKFVHSKNEIILSNIFLALGLEIFLISIKKKLFTVEEGEGKFNLAIDLVLNNVVSCLELSNSLILSKTLKILTRLFDCKLPIIKKNLRKIVKHCFRNLNLVNSQDINLSQTILSSIGDILTKFRYTDISDNKIKILINFIKLNASNTQIKPYVYSCFLNIIKRKILHPSIYDMINFISENYLTAFEENTLTLCQNILTQFLSDYPLEEPRRISQINFFVINLESSSRKCVMNSLKMLYRIFKEFYGEEKKDFMNGIVDFVIVKLLTMLTNERDPEVKALTKTLIERIFAFLDKEREEGYLNKVTKWLLDGGESQDQDKAMIRLSLNLSSVLLNDYKENMEKRVVTLRDALMVLIKSEVEDFTRQLNDKLEREEFTRDTKDKEDLDKLFSYGMNSHTEQEEDIGDIGDIEEIEELSEEENEEFSNYKNKNKNINKSKPLSKYDRNNNSNSNSTTNNTTTVINLQFDNWDILYLSLVTLEKLVINYPKYFKSIITSDSAVIIKCLEHPHVFIKTVAMRFISNMMTNEDTRGGLFLDEEIVNFLFTNFKFFILSVDTSDKLVHSAIKNSSLLIAQIGKLNNTNLYNSSLEFVCRLYMESKSLVSNKDKLMKIVERVFDLYDSLISSLEEDTLKNYVEPIISLAVRVLNHRLVEEETKKKTENILNNLRVKIPSDYVAIKFKEVKDKINLIKRKRKVDLMQNSLNNQKEYIKKKYKLK